MLKYATLSLNPSHAAEAILATSLDTARQSWLAGLGAVAVSREWAQKQARPVFRGLVKQGAAVETQAIRVIGKRIETSIAAAESLWTEARKTVLSTVHAVGKTAAATLPKFKLNVVAKRVSPASTRKAAKPVKARTSRRSATRRTKRSSR